jgi:hypothetical protein
MSAAGTVIEDFGSHLRWFFRWAWPISLAGLFIGFAFQFASLFL